MTKKKRHHPDADEILARPWCYYCERDFDDLKILINHQKAKHFKCERCGRRLNTAGGLSVHMSQVHKENLTAVDNALPNRAGLDIEIFGMEGIPEEIMLQHNQRVLTSYHQAEAERRAGGGGPGSAGGNGAKKPKTEDISDLKKRLAEHKAAKLAAENGGSSGSLTPVGAGQSNTPTPQQTTYQIGSPAYPQYQQSYAPPPSSASFSQPPQYAQSPAQTNFSPMGYGQPPIPQQYQQPPYVQGPPQSPYVQQPVFPPQPSYSPAPYPNQPPYPGPHFQPQVPQNGSVSYPGQPVGQPRPYAGSPISVFSPQNRTQSPAQVTLPQRTGSGSLPAAPGLPSRPTFAAPPVNAFQFQQMHQGQIPAPQTHVSPQPQYHGPLAIQTNGSTAASVPPPGVSNQAPNAQSLDDLISSASKQADVNALATASKTNGTHPPAPPPASASTTAVASANTPPAVTTPAAKDDATEEKTSKKDKEKEKGKQTRLVYSDNEISPEEKMAMLPRYAYTPLPKTTQV